MPTLTVQRQYALRAPVLCLSTVMYNNDLARLDSFYIVNGVLTIDDVIDYGYIDPN